MAILVKYVIVLATFLALAYGINTAVTWEQRNIECYKEYCHPDDIQCQETMSECKFSKGKVEPVDPAECDIRSDTDGKPIRACQIHCRNGDRDSVILKTPAWRQECLRHYTYNTKDIGGDWVMELKEECNHVNVTLSVWCGFPYGVERF